MQQKLFGEFRTATVIVIIIVATVLIALLFNWFTKLYINRSLMAHDRDLTSFQFFRHIISALIYIVGFVAALTQIPEFKVVGHSLLAGAGVISLVAGLASQQALSNIMSGILIVVFKPFRLNDKITLRSTFTGVVEDINLRQVVIRDAENNRIIIPNSVISSDLIVNAHMSDNRCCKMIDFGIGYSSSMEKALEIMKEEVLKHPLQINNRTKTDIKNNIPPVIASVLAMGDSAVNLRVWPWAETILNTIAMKDDYRFKPIQYPAAKIIGAVSLSVAVLNRDYLTKENAVPSLYFHGKLDDKVPYRTAAHHNCKPKDFGYLLLDGLFEIVNRLKELNVFYHLFTDPTGGHEWSELGYKYP